MSFTSKVRQNPKLLLLVEILALVLISALVYLPYVTKFGYYYDDWYLMYDAKSQGAQFFTQVFKDDRPLRALVMIPAYTLFGGNPLPYNLLAYLMRVGGALAFLWVTRILWPKQRMPTFLMSLLFLIYPGFLSQPNAIDYLSHQVSLVLALLSIALTLKAIQVKRPLARWLLHLAALTLGWFYLGLMEYYIGFEVFRWGAAFVLLVEQRQPFWGNLAKTVRACWPALFIPAGFLVWRLFFFQSERSATDLGAQLGQLAGSPVLKGLWWLVYFVQSVLNTIFLAWGVPLYNLAFQLRLRDSLAGLGVALACAALAAGLLLKLKQEQVDPEDVHDQNNSWSTQAIGLGLVGVAGGLALVIVANRYVNFADYSRYTLVSLAGAVMLIVGALYKLTSQKLRLAVVLLLVGISAMTHHANSVNAMLEAQSVRNFWWQVSWRVPQLEKGTTLLAYYPLSKIPEDYFIWGPANMIYAAEKQDLSPINVPIPAALLTRENILKVNAGVGEQFLSRRGANVTQDFGNVLILSQPAANVCVRVLDGGAPELSTLDPYDIMLTAEKSRLDNVLTVGMPQVPVEAFGPEPEHDWCFYYEKAALARQTREWQFILALREAALEKGYYPSDRIEWMPFLQAYAALGDLEGLQPYVSIMTEEPFIRSQACSVLLRTAEQERPNDVETLEFIRKSFCD